MKVSELIAELQRFMDTQGDLDVKIYADHGQVHMNAGEVNLSYTEDKEEWMSEPVNPDDAEEHHDRVCEIG